MSTPEWFFPRLMLRETTSHENDPVVWQKVQSQAYHGGVGKFPYLV